MENTKEGKCKHSGCGCNASSTGEYCSDQCRTAGEGGGGECMCGHPGCGTGGGGV